MNTMKKIITIIAIFFTIGQLMAQKPAQKNYTGAEIEFDHITADLGTLNIGDVKETFFTFTNIGKKPLILDNVIISCDCTEIEWPKTPVMPGQIGKIKVIYTAKNSGSINKWATVLSNAEKDRVILTLKGKVN